MRTLRFGVLGCADIARRRLLPAMAAHPDITIGAVASRDPRRAESVAGQYGCRPVTGYAALLEDETIDAVYVPLPVALHYQWVEAALLAGKHVLAEKPLTADPSATRRLFALARERRLALLENVMFVHHAQHAAVRALVADGVIGELRSFHGYFGIPRLPDGDIRYNAVLGGGSLWDVGIYPMRAAIYFLGRSLRVAAALLTDTRSAGTGSAGTGASGVDTAGAALLRSPDGVQAHVTFGLDHGYRSGYELWGSLGRIALDRAFTPPAEHTPRIRIETASGSRVATLPPDDQVANTLSAMVAAARADGREPGQADCLAQADLLDMARRAAGQIIARRPGPQPL